MTCAWASTEQGFAEETTFSDRGQFMVTVRPTTPARGGVLLCSSLGEDVRRNHRREALLARRLASRGLVAHRFAYRGTGNSLGEPAETTPDSVLDDATTAFERLQAECAGLPLGVVGVRFGAIVATVLTHDRPEHPLALWDPPPEAASFGRELLRIERMLNVTDRQVGEARPVTMFAGELPPWVTDEPGVLGSLRATGLGAVLVAVIGRSTRRTGDQAITALRAGATDLQVRKYAGDAAWSPATDLPEHGVDEAWPLLDDTVAWFAERTGAKSRP